MCGFVGFVDKTKKEEKTKIIKNMNDQIIHRGPDSEGYYINKEVALGFRRLAIIDLNTGDQPMFNEDKSMVIVFNGEIYNYQSLKDDLIKKGHIFKNTSDTEVLIHGYEEYGTKILDKLRGMYAFFLYDIKNNKGIGVRDIFGIKPFYYYKKDNTFIFGSEIKSFLKHPNFKKELNKEALQPYLSYQHSSLEETFFKNTFKLKPGHYLIYEKGQITISPYFKFKYEKENKSYNHYKESIKETLLDSIDCHQIADVEVGSYLSGGVDSSYVVSVAKPDKTFTVGFSEKGFNEGEYAKELSNIFNVKNYQKLVSADEFFDILPTIQYHTDEPMANLSTVPLYFLSQLAHPHVKVVLSGEGCDEMFGGYHEYEEPFIVKLYTRLPLKLRQKIANKIKDKKQFKGQRSILYYSQNLEERYISRVCVMREEEAKSILKKDYQQDNCLQKITSQYYKNVKDMDTITKKMYIDLNLWLPDDILLKADKMSMANSLELRVPFLDKEIWKLSSKIPSKYFIKGRTTKHIFRSVTEEYLPTEWMKRRKLGFPVPFGLWVKEKKYYNYVKEAFLYDWINEFFDSDKINKLLEDHCHNIRNNGRKIWTIYSFIVWYKKFFIDLK